MGLVHQLIEKQRAVFAQGQVDFLRLGRQRGAVGEFGQAAPQRHLAAGQQHHGRTAQRNGAGLVAQARPHQFAAAAQLVEPGRGVILESSAEQVTVPGRRGGSVAFELADNLRQHRTAVAARAVGQVLPIEQKAHEVLQCHRLDFPAQAPDRVAMNPREQMPLTPLLVRGAGAETAAQHVAFLFQARQCRRDVCHRQGQRRCNFAQAQRAKPAKAGTQHFRQRIFDSPGLIEARQQRQVVGVDRLHTTQALHGDPKAILELIGAPALGQGVQPLGPLRRDLIRGDAGQAHQRLMHFVQAVGGRPRFLAHAGDGFGIQCAEVVGAVRVAPAPVEHRLGAAFFQRGVVEKGVRARAENFRGHGRGRGQVAADQAHLAAFHAPQQGQPTFAVHGFVQAVVEGLFHQRVFGYLTLAGEVFQAGDLVGKHAGNQVFALHALDLRRDLAPAGITRQCQGHTGIPAPAHAEQWRIQHRLDQDVLGAVAVQVAPHLIELKAVAGGQRQHDRILTGRRLQFKIEGAAKTLAQGQAPGAVEAAAERCMDDQLGAAGGVEKALHDQRVLGRQGTKGQARAGQVIEDLFGAGVVQAEAGGEPVLSGLQVAGGGAEQRVQLRLKTRHGRRQFMAAPRCFTEPERDGRRLAMGILDAYLAGLDPQDPVGRVAELEDIPGDAFDREVFVDAADIQALRFKQHAVVSVIRDGAAAGHGGQPGTTAAPQGVGYGVAVQVGAADALAAVIAVGEHLQQRLVVARVEVGVGRGALDQRQ